MVINKNGKTSRAESRILARFSGAIAAKKKNITFNINEELLERLDTVAAMFSANDGNTTRTDIIEDALTSYIETAEDFFEEQNLKEDQDITSYTNPDDDTAVFPAINDNFSSIFIADQEWRYVRVAESRRNKIKYIALYRGAPISAITHYAEVIDVSDQIPEKDNKRVIKVKEPVPLPHSVELGNITVQSVRKLFYTKLNQLKAVATVEELLYMK
ncbi:hypothetical protein EV210_12314 [Anaerospora hongkongensis]|uniref:Uncharacterized protein n=1 Tax=Anaerospora hongkongensis TaxID=244830 RepID=A0A4R1PND5_9FIRM|nr:hypothetical protein [Anaerospora hongkongensis]TCL32194.1 hypothetical protein EV210_12314 [Anaerospora hongkongensis]